MTKVKIGPFLGPITALDSRAIDTLHAQDVSNYSYEDGKLTVRFGYRNLDGIPTNFTSIHGLAYIQGYTAANALAEEFITAERLSTMTALKCKFFTRVVTTGAETEITNGGTPVEVTNVGDWRMFAWDDVSYFTNPNETTSIYRHTIGTPTSLLALAKPPDPTTQLTYRIDLASGGSSQYENMSWATIDAADLAVTGAATTTVPTGGFNDGQGGFRIQHSLNTIGTSSVTVDMNGITAGIQDRQHNDIYAWLLSTPVSGVFKISPSSIRISGINNDGSPLTFIPTKVDIIPVGTAQTAVRIYFGNKTRADWDNLRKWKIEYDVTVSSGTANLNILTVARLWIGCCQIVDPSAPTGRTPEDNKQDFGYSYMVNATTLESGIAGRVLVPNTALAGLSPYPGMEGLGAWVTFTHVASANADKVRYYWLDRNLTPSVFRRLTTQDDTTLTFTLKMDYQELLNAAAYADGPLQLTGCIAGIPYKGWVAWLYQGGSNNVRHSRIGLPESQASDSDQIDDPNAGETYSLADNYGDEPVNGCQADDALIVAGTSGVYAQLGDRPLLMSFFRKLPGSFGVPSYKACTRAMIDGITGLVALAKDGEGLYFYPGIAGQSVPLDYQTIELTEGIRPSLKAFLLDAQSLTNWSTAIVVYEPNTDAIWLIVGARAMRLPKPSLIDGKRQWQFYRYGVDSSETVSYAVASTRRRIKWFRSHGKFDEVEYRYDTGAYIDGATRDGGNAIPASSIFWKSKRLRADEIAQSDRAWAGWGRVHRSTLTDNQTVKITAYDRGASTATSKSVADNRVDIRFGTRTIGEEFDIEIIGTEGDAALSYVEVEFNPVGSKRRV